MIGSSSADQQSGYSVSEKSNYIVQMPLMPAVSVKVNKTRRPTTLPFAVANSFQFQFLIICCFVRDGDRMEFGSQKIKRKCSQLSPRTGPNSLE